MAGIARVVVEIALDREFDYRIPEELGELVQPGCLVEVPFGRGRALVTSLLLAEKSAGDPAAATLLHRSLEYLSSLTPREARRIVPLSPCPGLTAQGVSLASADAPLDLSTAAVAALEAPRSDWSRLQDRQGEIVGYVTAGGTLYVHDLTPDTAQQLSALTGLEIECHPVGPGTKWWLDPSKIASPKAEHPLTSGLGSFDLNWTVFVSLISGQLELPDRLLLNSVHCRAPGAEELTASPEPGVCALLRIPLGRGQVVVDQVLWDTTRQCREYVSRADVGFGPAPGRGDIAVTSEVNSAKANRYIATLITNMLVPVGQDTPTR